MRCSYGETISDVSALKGCFFFPKVAEGLDAASKTYTNLNIRCMIQLYGLNLIL